MINPSTKSNVFKYLIIFFVILSISTIFLIFILNNKNHQSLPSESDLNNKNPQLSPTESKQSSIENNSHPDWVNKLIEEAKENEVANPPTSLIKCFYQDEIVYYLPARCCDIPSLVFNEAGDVVCSPDGGITGRGDGKCLDFFESKKDCVTIWQDTR